MDGHDVNYLVKVLNDIKDMQGPKLLHIKTKKEKALNLRKSLLRNGMLPESSIRKPASVLSFVN